MNRLARYASGNVRFEVIGGRGERFLNECVNADIPVEHIAPTATGYLATVPLRDYKKLRPLARRNRCGLRVREKRGAYFALRVYRGRWGIAVGAVLCALILLSCENLIWNICFVDFTPTQEASIRALLFENGVYEGAFQSSEKLMQAAGRLFIESNDFGWIRLNFVKGRLVVEKTRREKELEPVGTEITNVVAACDGIVRGIDLADGYPQVVIGQYVSSGQLLVSGMLVGVYEIPHYAHAEAAVTAEVQNTYTYSQPLHGETTLPTMQKRSYYKLYLPWGELPLYRRIDVPDSASVSVSRRPAAPLGFHLPALIEETLVRDAKSYAWTLTERQAADIARSRILDMIRTQFGEYEILEERKQVDVSSDTLTLSLRVRFLANIAKQVPYEEPAAESSQTNAPQAG